LRFGGLRAERLTDMKTYDIGPLTMEYVFKRAGIENVSDMQAVFDAVEGALEYKNERFKEMAIEYRQQIDAARYEDRA